MKKKIDGTNKKTKFPNKFLKTFIINTLNMYYNYTESKKLKIKKTITLNEP